MYVLLIKFVSIYNELTTMPKFSMERLSFELRLKNNNKIRLNKNGTVYKGSATEILSKSTLYDEKGANNCVP